MGASTRLDGGFLRAGGFAAAAAFLLLATAAPVQGSHTAPGSVTPATLYFHGLEKGSEFPINTQNPPENLTVWGPDGAVPATFTCVALPVQTMIGRERHTVYGYSHGGPVDYTEGRGGRPALWWPDGLRYDVQVDLVTPWILHWYVLVAPPSGSDAGGVPPGGLPAGGVPAPVVVVEASVRSGVDSAFRDYDTGALLAHGRSNATTLQPGMPGHSKAPDGRDVYAFEVRLEPRLSAIPATHGYVVRVDTYVENPACNDGHITPSYVGWYSDATRRPRMTLGVLDALRVLSVQAALVPEGMAVTAEVESPWGDYDVDPQAVMLRVTGAPPDAFQPQVLNLKLHSHDYPRPHQAAWLWSSPTPGTYTLAVEATNLQHTAKAHGTSEVTVPGEEAPAPGAALTVIALLGACAVLLSRSRRGR